MGTYENLLNTAQGVYNNAQGDVVPTQGTAPINPEQYAGINNVNYYANAAQPGLQTAQQLAYNAASPITSGQIQQYMNPYTQDVVNSTEAQFANQNQQQMQGVKGNAIAQGALGGNREAVAEAETANQQNLAQAPVISGLYNSAYNTGLNTALTEQQAGLSGALGLGNLATASQSAGLQGAGAQIGAGTTEQQTQQQELTNQYTQQMQQMGLPLQLAQWYAGIATGVGSQMGGTSSTTAPPPSLFAQLLGAGTAAAGLAGKASAHGGAVNLASGGGVSGPSLMDQARDIGSLSDAMLGRNPQPQQPGVRGYDSGGGVANALGMNPFGSSGFVPGVQIVSGKGAPAPPKATTQPNPLSDFDKMYKAGQGLGTAYDKSSLGDSVQDSIQDMNDDADDSWRGGVVRGYDDGGFVPDVKITEGSGAPPPPKPPSTSSGSGGGILGSLISGIGSLGSAAVSALGEAAPEVGAALADAAPFVGLALRRGGGVRGLADGGPPPSLNADGIALPDTIADDPLDTDHNSGVITRNDAKIIRKDPGALQDAKFDDRYNDDMRQIERTPHESFDNHFDNDVDAVRGVGSMEGKQKIAEAPVSTLRDHLNSEYSNDPIALKALNPAMQGSAVALAARPVSSDDTSSVAPTPAPGLAPGRDVADVRGSTAYAPREAVEQMADHIQKTGAPPDKPPGINPKFWDALISAGFSMMASRSPYLGVAIGQGGLAGMQSYTNATQQETSNKMKQSEIDARAAQLHNTIMNQEREYRFKTATPRVIGEIPYMSAPSGIRKVYGTIDSKTGQVIPSTPSSSVPTTSDDVKNATLTGEDYLKTLSPAEANYLRAVGRYESALPPASSRAPMAQKLRNDAFQAYPDSIHENMYPVYNAAIKKFFSGPNSDSTRSFNVSMTHLDSLQKAADALGHGDYPVVNKLLDWYHQETGKAAPTDFNAVRNIVGDEIVKAVVGARGALGDREEAKESIARAFTPEQFKGVIDHYKELMAGQLMGQRQQFTSTTNLSPEIFDRFLSPETKEQLLHHNATSPPPASASPSSAAPATPVPAPVIRIQDGKRYQQNPDGSYKYLGPVQ